MTANPNLSSILLDNVPWSAQAPSIWAATALTLKRNLSRFHFPSKMQKSEKGQALELLKNLLLNLKELNGAHFFSEEQLSLADKELLCEHFLMLQGFSQPPGEAGIVVDQRGGVLALINRDNHLELRALSLSGNWDAVWDLLSKIEAAVAVQSDVAFSPKFGYLTSDFTQCGTGLLVQSYLHLPALICTNKLVQALPKEEEDVVAMGLLGNLEELIGDMLVLKNKYTLGLTEESILQSIQTASSRLVGAEKTARAEIKEKQTPQIKDLISKAYGLLMHAYQLEIKEALGYLSLIKLGIDLGWISGISDQKMSALFFHIRRGHLSHLFPALGDAKELGHKRAEFLHKELQGITLGPQINT